MKRYMITFYDEEKSRLFGRYAYYTNSISDLCISRVIDALFRCGIITEISAAQMANCKCIMIEEDN